MYYIRIDLSMNISLYRTKWPPTCPDTDCFIGSCLMGLKVNVFYAAALLNSRSFRPHCHPCGNGHLCAPDTCPQRAREGLLGQNPGAEILLTGTEKGKRSRLSQFCHEHAADLPQATGAAVCASMPPSSPPPSVNLYLSNYFIISCQIF